MVYFDQLSEERSSRIELIISKATPLNEMAEGEFGEGTTYNFKGKSYPLKDLPDYVAKGAGLVIEFYLELIENEIDRENDNQR